MVEEKTKLKARLRNERCENCIHKSNLTHFVTTNSEAKPRIRCLRHKHLKKADSWCRFYKGSYND